MTLSNVEGDNAGGGRLIDPNPVEEKPRATWTPLEPFRFLLLIVKYYKLLILSAMAGLIAMTGVMLIVGPRYDISAKLLVTTGREITAPRVLDPLDGVQAIPASRRPEDANTEVEILSNPRLMKRVVEHFGEDFFLAERPAVTLWQQIKRVPKVVWRELRDAMREGLVLLGLRPPTTALERVTLAMQKGLVVESIRRSDVIEIKLGFPDPRAGVLVMQKFIEFALESHIQAHRASGVGEFFSAQKEAKSRELREAEQHLLDVRTKMQGVQAAEIEIAKLERDVAGLRRIVGLYEKGLENARTVEAMDVYKLSNLRVIMQPTADLLPAYPPLRRFLLLGLIGGLTLAIGFIVLKEMLSGTLHDPAMRG